MKCRNRISRCNCNTSLDFFKELRISSKKLHICEPPFSYVFWFVSIANSFLLQNIPLAEISIWYYFTGPVSHSLVKKKLPSGFSTKYTIWVCHNTKTINFEMNEPWPFEKIAKVATKNRQNRQMAEFRQTYYMKLVEHQILCGKLVSQASFEWRSP